MLPGNVRSKHIADALGFDEAELWDASHRLDEWFQETRLKRVGGKHREIDPPTEVGRRRLQRLAAFVSSELPVHSAAHGSVRGKSPFTSASRHLGDRHIVTYDIKNCFPSTDPDRFRSEMIGLGLAHDVAILLTRLLLYRSRLPQGSPASNAALNLYFYRTDEQIRTEVSRFGGRYTRYCDDLVVSVGCCGDIPATQRVLEGAITSLGYQVNMRKQLEGGIQLVGTGERYVNGIVTNSSRYTKIPSERVHTIFDDCHRFIRGARSVSHRSLVGLARLRRQLGGLVNYTSQAGKSPIRELRRLLSLGDQAVLRQLSRQGLMAHGNCWWLKNQELDEAVRLAAAWSALRSNGVTV